MPRKLTILIGILGMLITVSLAFAQGRGRGQAGGSATTAPAASPSAGGFGKDEARIIADWFHDSNNLSGLPPGLAKREQLPPGPAAPTGTEWETASWPGEEDPAFTASLGRKTPSPAR
jgi:hypothetical protein